MGFSVRPLDDPHLRTLVDCYVLERDVAGTTATTYRCAVNSFSRWLGRPGRISDLASRINEYLSDHSRIGSRYTTRGYRVPLVALLRRAAASNLCRMPEVVRRIKVPQIEPLGFSDDELQRLRDFADPVQLAAILVAYDTGFRWSDVFAVTWGDVDPLWCVRVIVNKTGRHEARMLTAATVAACARLQAEPGPRSRLVPFAAGRTAWDKRWRRLGKRAGVDVYRRGLQAMRRTGASLVAREHGEVAAAAYLGHSAASGVAIFRNFYRVGAILDRPPPGPPPIRG